MSVFGSIMSSIFGGAAPASPPTASVPFATASQTAPPDKPATPAATPTGSPNPAGEQRVPAAAPREVDVAEIMDKLADASSEDLDWRKSIVDLMKLLKLDSSFAARKKLAAELHYTGSTKDSAAMNVWLHKQVMLKLAENGGKVPSELQH
jgi:hypothetical protein